MATLLQRMVPWMAPVDSAVERHGAERYLLFGILERETMCGTSPHLDVQGPGGTGDFKPRLWLRYADRVPLCDHLNHWRPTLEVFKRFFPKWEPKDGEDIPEICMPADGRGWGRGGFQPDFAAQTEWCLEKHANGLYLWEIPEENADKAASILTANISAFDGDEWFAASAYNAGIKNVRHALFQCSEPATPEKRRACADAVTTGGDYAASVMHHRKECRLALTPTAQETPNV